MRLMNIYCPMRLMALTLAVCWSANSARAQFFQSEAPDHLGRYSFLDPGRGAFGAVEVGYVRVENPTINFSLANATGDPAIVARTDIDSASIGGHVGYSLGRDSQLYIPMLGADYRVVAGGSYFDGETMAQNTTTGGTTIFALTDSTLTLFEAGDTINRVFADFSQTEINVSFQGDHYRDTGLIITKGLGYTFIRRTADYRYTNRLASDGSLNTTLIEQVATDYNALDVFVSGRYRVAPNFTAYVAGRMAFFRATATSRAQQDILGTTFGDINSPSSSDAEFGVRPRGEVGLAYENEYFHIGVLGSFDHISYVPQVKNPQEMGDPNVLLIDSSSNIYGVKLFAGARF
jgi:hypothetical protein